MPAFCSAFIFRAGKIDASLKLAGFEILLLNNQRRFKNFNDGATVKKYLDGSGGNCLKAAIIAKLLT